MSTALTLKIADVVIAMESRYPLERLSRQERREHSPERFGKFIVRGATADIRIRVAIAAQLPSVKGKRAVFITRHPSDGQENWRLIKDKAGYIYVSLVEGKKQVGYVSADFSRVVLYVLPKGAKGKVWNFTDVVYDFLQVLLIQYLALRKAGIIVHSVGIKDSCGSGLLFAGKSGVGKSTTARLWYGHTTATILNDDRVAVRKKNGAWYLYGTPWHGEFSDYLPAGGAVARLKTLFFIRHAPANRLRRLTVNEAFRELYPTIIPTFWDKRCLSNIVECGHQLVQEVPCCRLGFVNDPQVISFVRKAP